MSLRRSIPAFFLIFVFAFTLFLISRRQTRQADHQAWSDPTSTFALKSSLAGIPPTSAFNTPYWSPDGHLYFLDNQPSSASILSRLSTPPAQHPIFLLIRNATISWQAKLSQQSPDLLSAAAEYYRRHKRHPPRDFDRWWRWASDHKVKLLDEYDSMYRALEPFFALPPSVFRERVNDLLNGRTKWKDDLFIISIRSGNLSVSGSQAHNGPRPREMLNLLKGIAHLLPDVDLPISTHDLPTISVSAKNYERHVQLARESKYVPRAELNEPYDEPGLQGWPNTCPPRSKLRLELDGIEQGLETRRPSYIYDHVPSMSMCNHPELSQRIGFLSTNRPKVHAFFPLFSFSKPHGFAELPLAPTSQYSHPIGPDPAWEDKTSPGLLWRGGNSGIWFNKESNWRQSQRSRLVKLANEAHGMTSVRHISLSSGKMASFEADTSALNAKYFDIGFAGHPVQCDQEDGTCATLQKMYTFKPSVEAKEMNRHKYLMDVDGNGWSGRFHRLMGTRSAVLKSTIFPEWYADRIQPWYHYIPVRVDYQDLYDIMAFFTGDLNGKGAQDEAGKMIGEAGSQWAQEFWRIEDMQAYMYRLILEYSRLINRRETDGGGMDFSDFAP